MDIKSTGCSEWHKWDLHIHTPYTWLCNQYGQNNDNTFVEKIVESKISAVGLTNYFSFHENEIFASDSIRKKLIDKGIVVFPNLEFRLSYQNKEGVLCDYHVIFSPDLPNEDIRSFLENLEIHIGRESKKASKLTEEELRSNQLYVDVTNIQKAIDETRIRDSVMLGFMADGKGESRSSGVSDSICAQSDFIIHSRNSSKKIDEDFKFWTSPNEHKDFVMPIFQSSDSHKLDDIGAKFTWIKGKINFDGLYQTKFNPAERIRFQENSPSENKLPQTIIRRIKSKDGDITFSNDLNSFIGKRGGGKSILLKAIAQKASPEEYRSRFEEQNKIDKDLGWLSTTFGDDYEIEWADGYSNIQEGDGRSILYLPQGYLSNLAYDEYDKVEERNDFITDLLMKFLDFRNAKDICATYNNKTKNLVEENIGTIVELSKKNRTLKKISHDIGSSSGIKNGVAVLDDKIKQLSKKCNITDAENKKYQHVTAEMKNLRAKYAILKQDLSILEKISLMDNILSVRNDIFLGLSDSVKEQITSRILDKNKNTLQEIISDERSSLQEQIITITNTLEDYEKIISKLRSKFVAQKELNELTNRKLEFEKSIKQLEENEALILKNEKDINDAIEHISDLYFSYGKITKDIYASVHLDFLEFSEIVFTVQFSNENYIRAVEHNMNRSKNSGLSEASKLLLKDELYEPTTEQLQEVINDVLSDNFVFKTSSGNDKKQFLSSLLNNPYSVDYLNSIRVKESDTTFDQMTGGQKAITMLELIFKLDTNNYPILIDQPEDDLDANGIATNVVDFIKEQKEKRQIFIASHNANLVVCADSEEIIVADRDVDFSYSSGAIEDKQIRKNIVDILEGGKDALDLRMKKLRIHTSN